MHLAYSALGTTTNNRHQPAIEHQERQDDELLLRYQAYETACNKYSREIAAIQKYLPGWAPEFR